MLWPKSINKLRPNYFKIEDTNTRNKTTLLTVRTGIFLKLLKVLTVGSILKYSFFDN